MDRPQEDSRSKVTQVRSERDSLGVVEVPADALYGAQTARAVTNFPISGRTSHPELIRAYLRVKKAAAKVNARLDALPAPAPRPIHVSKLIQKAVDELLATEESRWPQIFPVDPYQAGAGTSQNMNVNEVVANCANRIAGEKLGVYKPVHPNDHVNCSQSTNDSFPTAMRLGLLEASKSLVVEVRALASSFSAKARKWKSLLKSARTHLQDAVPMTLGQEFAAYAAAVGRCADWIELARRELARLGIGGSAAGTGLTVPKGYAEQMVRELSALTGEKLVVAPDLFEAMQSQAPIAVYSSSLRVLALELTRICNDLRLLASGPMTGLGEIRLPAIQPGSSIMPGKVNPSVLEMANQTWFSVLGYDHAIAGAVAAGQLELNVMMPIMAYSGLEATRVATNTLRILRTRCVDGIEANEERLRRYFESTTQVATALSPRLGYEATAKLVQEALASGVPVIELVRERNLVPDRELRKLLDVKALTGQS